MRSVHGSPLERIADASAAERMLIAARNRLEGEMIETPDKVAALLHTVRLLDAIGVRYALIGGVAVGIHSGVPRATLDTDIAVTSSHDRAAVVAALTTAGFRLVGEHSHSVNLRHVSGEPVQLAFDAFFDPMIERAETFRVGDHRVRIVGRQDLIETKRRAAADPARRKSKALRDQADVELLLGDVPDPDEGW